MPIISDALMLDTTVANSIIYPEDERIRVVDETYSPNQYKMIFLEHTLLEGQAKNGFTIEGPVLKIIFKEAGIIDGRKIDVIYTLDQLDFGPQAKKEIKDGDQICITLKIEKDGFWIAGADLTLWDISDPVKRRNSAEVKYSQTMNIVYADNQEIVNIPFIFTQGDIDIHPGDANSMAYTNERLETVRGFNGEFFTFKGSYLLINENGPGQIMVGPPKGADFVEDDLSWKKAGIYALTDNGNISFNNYLGSCATMIQVRSVYKNSDVTKEVDKESFLIGDKLTYRINFRFGNLMEDVLGPYESLSINDDLPDRLEYLNAFLVDQKGNEVSDIGVLDTDGKHVSFTFDKEWLKDKNNYKGQTYGLIIETRVKDNAPIEIVNKGYKLVNGIKTESNEVKSYQKYPVFYEYRSADQRPLPAPISTTDPVVEEDMIYQVLDDQYYYSGETVIRKDPESNRYTESDEEGNRLGRWDLSWEKDQEIMSEGGILFIGTWNYREYKLPEGPLKKIVSSDNVKKGDQVIFEIFQKIGKWEEDTDDLYQSLSIKDVLAADLKYEKAVLLDETGEDITDKIGSLSFDRLGNEIRYDFSEEFLADKDNYGGQTYVLRIEGKVDKTSGNIPNQA
ncbi:MAG: isopeptide-forming domain-containing fimbrial protein, partial [Erysipelotrichaceae bacterium]|nr:isopeptide-forming domain-containing fimbrial protein [Erysipelotrichaceae bacterium]